VRPRRDKHQPPGPRLPGGSRAARPLALALEHLASGLDPARPQPGAVVLVAPPPGWLAEFFKVLREPWAYARDILQTLDWSEADIDQFLALDEVGFEAFIAEAEERQ
jgi:hypothetical protein